MKNVLFIASEAVPFIKTGGLADVVGALPKYFNKDEFDVRVMIPKYTCIPWEYREKMVYKTHFYIDLAWRTQYVGVFEMEYQGVTFYFIDNEFYFSGPKPYSWIHEDIEKFAFFSKAALSAIPTLGFRPDIIHCHDWQTGLVPVYLKERFAQGEFYQGVKSVMTIHNLKFQGIWDLKKVKDITGLPDSYFTSDKLEAYKDANYLKGGIVYADMVTTVSSTYAEEIKMPFYGEGLDGILSARRHQLSGILNGIDRKLFNPYTDPLIPKRYDRGHLKGKQACKEALMFEMGLQGGERSPLVAMVTRMTDQKGFDLVERVLDEMLDFDIRFLLLGSGAGEYEQFMREAEARHRGRVCAYIGYNEELSHRVYAGADMLLMPSRFEPCGLTQLVRRPEEIYTGADTEHVYIQLIFSGDDAPLYFNYQNDLGQGDTLADDAVAQYCALLGLDEFCDWQYPD